MRRSGVKSPRLAIRAPNQPRRRWRASHSRQAQTGNTNLRHQPRQRRQVGRQRQQGSSVVHQKAEMLGAVAQVLGRHNLAMLQTQGGGQRGTRLGCGRAAY